MVAGAEKKLYKFTYSGENINWNFDKYDILHKDQHNILKSLKEYGCTGTNQQ